MKKRTKTKKGREKRPELEPSEEHKQFPIKLYIWDFKQCDPKKCTGMRLKHRKYVDSLHPTRSFKGLVLTYSQ